METKICIKCGRELPLECYSKNKSKKDGLQAYCKECTNRYKAKWDKENTAHNKQYYLEHKEERAEYFKQYNAENAEEIAEHKKQYNSERYATIEGYAYKVRYNNLQNDRKYGRCGKDEDILPPLEYYIWVIQQRDFYDGKQYHWSEMGLDRIYNDKPHTFANVVPCSTKNNYRRHRKSFEEFCELMRREKEELELVLN